MVVIPARGQERGLRTHLLSDFKAEDSVVEIQRALQTGNFEVYMADAHAAIVPLEH